MTHLTDSRFSFQSSGLPQDTFEVVRFKGSEGLNRCYSFEVLLVSGNPEVDFPAVVQHPAKLTLHREKGNDVHYHGILLGFEQLHSFGNAVFYRAILVPRLHWLSLTRHNQVFLKKSVPEFIDACLKDGGLSGLDFEFRLNKEYAPQEYVCQYGETHLDFVTRWCEREGMYYFFEQTEDGEKVVFSDIWVSHTSMPQGRDVRYSPPSGLETLHRQEIVDSFTCRYTLTPNSVLVKDYNYLKPSLEVTGMAEVDPNGQGTLYSYGDHILTPEEGNRLAKVYAEAVLCRRELYYGEGSVPYCSPGFVFDLQDHYRKGFNRGYLILDIDHEGSQTGYLIDGLTREGERREVYYRNNFTAIPDTVQYRPERATKKPKVSGCISAKVDAESSGQYAELDSHGRYKVVLPFDTSGRKDGKASAWLRMAQPYAGSDHGMHFPLHKGTEVLLTFIDGDPDRPIIQGAVPNPETPSVISEGNASNSGFRTAGGNQLSLQDEDGATRMSLSSGDGAFIMYGAGQSNSDPDLEARVKALETTLMTKSNYNASASEFYMGLGDYASSIASSFSFSAISNNLIAKSLKTLLEKWAHTISDTDRLGRKLGAVDKGLKSRISNPSTWWAMLMTIGPLIMTNMLKAYQLKKLGEKIEEGQHESLSARPIGNKAKVYKAHQQNMTYAKRLYSWAKTTFTGSTGDYGAVLFSHAPEKSFLKNKLFSASSAAMLSLSNGDPNVLVASSTGSVDIVGEEGVYLVSKEHVRIETKEATFNAKKGAHFDVGTSYVAIDPDATTVEAGDKSIFWVAKESIHAGNEKGSISMDTEKLSLEINNKKGKIILGVHPRPSDEHNASITMSEADKSIEMNSDGKLTCNSKDTLSLDATKKVSLAAKDATELDLGNDKSKLTLKGNNVRIAAFNVVRIG